MNIRVSKKNLLIAKNYDNHAVKYDKSSRTAPPWMYFDKPFIKKEIIPRIEKDKKILDLGCGAGKAIEILVQNGIPGKNVYGIDISKGLITIAKKNVPEARFQVGDFTRVELPKSYFDIAISVRSVEYLNVEELRNFFRNAHNALKKSGKLFLITGHPLRVNNAPVSTYLKRGPRRVSLPWGMEVDLYHKTISDLIMAAISVGFAIEYIDEPLVPLSLKRKNPKQYDHYKSYGATNLHLIFRKGA